MSRCVFRIISTVIAVIAMVTASSCQTGGGGSSTPTPVPTSQPAVGDAVARTNLTVVTLDVNATNTRGPAVGNEMLAFDADSGNTLRWLEIGETAASDVPTPSGMSHDPESFAFAGNYLVIRDRLSGGVVLL